MSDLLGYKSDTCGASDVCRSSFASPFFLAAQFDHSSSVGGVVPASAAVLGISSSAPLYHLFAFCQPFNPLHPHTLVTRSLKTFRAEADLMGMHHDAL